MHKIYLIKLLSIASFQIPPLLPPHVSPKFTFIAVAKLKAHFMLPLGECRSIHYNTCSILRTTMSLKKIDS